MSSLLLTLVIAFVLVMLSLGLLAIGWFISGKSRIKAGACGRNPHKNRADTEGCDTSINCQLCDQNKETVEKKNVKIP
jgi:hypothetical protein